MTIIGCVSNIFEVYFAVESNWNKCVRKKKIDVAWNFQLFAVLRNCYQMWTKAINKWRKYANAHRARLITFCIYSFHLNVLKKKTNKLYQTLCWCEASSYILEFVCEEKFIGFNLRKTAGTVTTLCMQYIYCTILLLFFCIHQII